MNIFETNARPYHPSNRWSSREDLDTENSPTKGRFSLRTKEVKFGDMVYSIAKPIKEIESPCNIQQSESDSDSDSDFNMFDPKPKQSVMKSVFTAPSYTLENILQASDIYKDYLYRRKDMAASFRQSVSWRFN